MQTLLNDPRGGVRDPRVHDDGQKILFSYRPGGSEAYHLYEINLDGGGLRQLTDGPDNDIEPTYTPDGGIVFSLQPAGLCPQGAFDTGEIAGYFGATGNRVRCHDGGCRANPTSLFCCISRDVQATQRSEGCP